MDYQVGEHNIDKTTSLESGELIEFDYENTAVFKRLADDIYESSEAGVREPIQNAITAVKRGYRETDLDEDNGVIRIKLYDGEQPKLVIRDNGIGISEEVLKNVLSVIGRSQNRDSGDLSGKFGMGFLSFYKLVGTVKGGFWMHSNSRENEQEPIKGIWKPSGFEMDTNDELPKRLDGDDYGTRFEIYVKENIDTADLRKWIEKHSEWARVPILYEEYNQNNEIIINNEYGVKSLRDIYENNNNNKTIFLDIDNEYYRIIVSEMPTEKTLLLNSPIERNSNYNNMKRDIYPSRFDIRIKNENGVIIDGPNRGLMPVEDSEYNNMSEKRKENYIPISQINTPSTNNELFKDNTDIVLPQPIGTRDKLESDELFWEYINKKIEKELVQKYKNVLSNIKSFEDFMKIQDDKKKRINHFMSKNMSYIPNSQNRAKEIDHNYVVKQFKSLFNLDISNELARLYYSLSQKVKIVNRGSKARDINGSGSYTKTESVTPIDLITKDDYDGSRYYMGIKMNDHKMNAVWDLGDNNYVVKIEDSDNYDIYEKFYNWRKLKNVSKYITEKDVSEEIYKKVANKRKKKSSDNVPIDSRHITLHKYQEGEKRSIKKNISQIKEYYRSNDNSYLILFPSNSNYNVSSHYDIVSDDISVAKCIVKIWDELSDLNNILKFSDWIDKVNNIDISTSRGSMKVSDLCDFMYDSSFSVMFHSLDSDSIDHFNDPEIMSKLAGKYDYSSIKSNNISENERIYIPIESKKIKYISTIIDRNELDECYTIYTDKKLNRLGKKLNPYDTNLPIYAWAVNSDMRNEKDLLRSLDVSRYSVDNWKDIINSMDTSDSKNRLIDMKDYDTYQTDKGKISINQMLEYDKILLFAVPSKYIPIVKDKDIIDDIRSYVIQNETARWSRDRIQDITEPADDIVFLPISDSKVEHIKGLVDNIDKIHIIQSKESKIGSSYNKIESLTATYAYAILSEDKYNKIAPSDSCKKQLPSLVDGGKEFVDILSSKD